jgi:hypothetical protein
LALGLCIDALLDMTKYPGYEELGLLAAASALSKAFCNVATVDLMHKRDQTMQLNSCTNLRAWTAKPRIKKRAARLKSILLACSSSLQQQM